MFGTPLEPSWEDANQPRESRSRSPTHSPSPSPDDETWGTWTGDEATSSQGPAQQQPQQQRAPMRDHVKAEPDTDNDIAQEHDPCPGWRQTAGGHWYPRRKPGEKRRGKPRVPKEEEPREPGGSGW